MPEMQKGYEWLWKEPGPKMILAALSLFGTKETAGSGNNPTIMKWAKEVSTTYPGDSTAWCGLFISVCAKRAGFNYYPNGNALWARNWADWGIGQKRPMLGDVLVFPRGQGGHVTFYVGEDATHYHCLGGNQGDTVNIVRKPKTPIIAIRRAPWKIEQPANVRVIKLKNTGAPVSTKES